MLHWIDVWSNTKLNIIVHNCLYLNHNSNLIFRWTPLIIGIVSWTDTTNCPGTTSNHAPNGQSNQSSAWVQGREITPRKSRSYKQIDWCWFHQHPSDYNFNNWRFRDRLVQGFGRPKIIFLPSSSLPSMKLYLHHTTLGFLPTEGEIRNYIVPSSIV